MQHLRRETLPEVAKNGHPALVMSAKSRRNSAKTNGVGWQNRAYLGSTAPRKSVKDCDRLLHFFTRFDPAFTLRLRFEAKRSISGQKSLEKQ